MVLDIEESFDRKVLAVVDEALARFHDFTLRQIWTITQFNVLASSNLALLLDLLAFDFVSHLMTISECIVLTDFA